MTILLNITPEDKLNWNKLTSLINEVHHQHFNDLLLNLQLPHAQYLSKDQQEQARSWGLSQHLPSTESFDYAISLRETDQLLPGSLLQWSEIVRIHPQSVISLASLNNCSPLYDQLHDYLKHHQERKLSQTFSQLAGPTTATTTLWSLQHYSIQSGVPSLKQLTRLQPTGTLLPASLINPKFPLVSLSQLFSALQLTPNLIRLHAPTLITKQWAQTTPLALLEQLHAIDPTKLSTDWQPLFSAYTQAQLSMILKARRYQQLSGTERLKILRQVKKMTLPASHPWTRLNSLRFLSPQIAHWLFY